jgi:hypothetical protein
MKWGASGLRQEQRIQQSPPGGVFPDIFILQGFEGYVNNFGDGTCFRFF